VLIQFRVENHRSLRDEQTLALAASGERSDGFLLRVDGLGVGVLPVVAIYGANASGKSNVLGALGFLRTAVVDSQRRWPLEGTPQEPFLLSSKARRPSLYEVDAIAHGLRFRYGFQLSASRVEEEWLFVWPHGRKAMWFERDGDKFEFGKSLRGANETIRELTRRNSLFLSAAAQNNHPELLPIVRYFSRWRLALTRGGGAQGRTLSAASMKNLAARLGERASPVDREAILQLLRAADTGIVDVQLVEEPRYQNPEYRVLKAPTMVFRHRSADDSDPWLPLASQSAGTVALLDLAPRIVDTLGNGGLLCIDELEASLHPALALSVVRMFNDPAHNPRGAQLVFATHDTHLLGSIAGDPVLRRDEVWFTEKDEAGATHLYPLTDFHPRKEENLERGYLQGRYGAIPFLGELVDPASDKLGDSSGGTTTDGEQDDPRGLR
jgi:predicted ATPase